MSMVETRNNSPCAFAIASGDDRRVNVNETAFLKKLVNCKREPAAHAKDATEKIRPWTKMSDFAQKFGRMPLLLQRVGIVSSSYDLNFVRDQLPFLSFTLRRDQRASDSD